MSLHGEAFARSAAANPRRGYRPVCSKRGVLCGEWVLPPENPSVGDIWFHNAENAWAFWTGEAWQVCGAPR